MGFHQGFLQILCDFKFDSRIIGSQQLHLFNFKQGNVRVADGLPMGLRHRSHDDIMHTLHILCTRTAPLMQNNLFYFSYIQVSASKLIKSVFGERSISSSEILDAMGVLLLHLG